MSASSVSTLSLRTLKDYVVDELRAEAQRQMVLGEDIDPRAGAQAAMAQMTVSSLISRLQKSLERRVVNISSPEVLKTQAQGIQRVMETDLRFIVTPEVMNAVYAGLERAFTMAQKRMDAKKPRMFF